MPSGVKVSFSKGGWLSSTLLHLGIKIAVNHGPLSHAHYTGPLAASVPSLERAGLGA